MKSKKKTNLKNKLKEIKTNNDKKFRTHIIGRSCCNSDNYVEIKMLIKLMIKLYMTRFF